MSIRRIGSPIRPLTIALGLVLAGVLAFSAGAGRANAVPGDPYADDFLGVAESYAVIAAFGISNTGPSVLTGDVGLHPAAGTFITGFPPGTITGTTNTATTGDPVAALAARSALTTAYGGVRDAGPPTETVGAANLDGRTLTAGIYFSPDDLYLDGTLTLSGGPDDVFIFQASTATLIVMDGSTVALTGGVQWCNVFWQVGSSATINSGSSFVGTILAATTISTFDTAFIRGRLLAGALDPPTGEVTLINTQVNSSGSCAGGGGGGPGGPGLDSLPYTGSESMFALIAAAGAILTGLVLVIVARRRPATPVHGEEI